MDIRRGQRISLSALSADNTFQLSICLTHSKDSVDFACFGLNAQRVLANERYMTFFNQPITSWLKQTKQLGIWA